MPIFNVTVDDVSPLIRYSGRWSDSSHTDPLWSSYSNGTFHATSQLGASATLTFNGSAVYLFGARRPNHGEYTVVLDGSSTVTNGNAANDFNSSLYSASGLSNSQHQLVLENLYTNPEDPYVDVDYVIFTSGDGNADTSSVDIVWDDSAADIIYTGAWETTPNGYESSYFQQTMHRTNANGASASILFRGNSISLYGATAANHGLFSVTLDSGSPLALNGTASVLRYQNMLYYAGGLSNDIHELILTNTDTNAGWLDLDMVKVSIWGNDGIQPSLSVPKPTSGSNPELNNGSSSGKKAPVGAIVGGVVGGVVFVLAVAALLFICWRRRSRTADAIRHDPTSKQAIEQAVVEPFLSSPRSATTTTPSTPDASTRNRLSSQPTDYSQDETVLQSQSPPSTTFTLSTKAASSARTATEPSTITQENPHRDFPPPAYDEATASRRP